MYLNYLASLSHYIPELVLCVTMMGLILVECTYVDDVKGSSKGLFYSTAYLGLFFALIQLFKSLGSVSEIIFSHAVVIDSYSGLAKMIMVIGTLAAVYLGHQSKDIYEDMKAEYTILIIGVLIGGMLLASANNFLIFYIAIEILSILSYVLASFKKKNEKSSEAGLKYSLYGGISAGIMLFGMSHIFGVLGTIQFHEIMPAMKGLSGFQVAVLLPSFMMFFAGVGYKIACVPFHMWAPDVYEGSPLPVTAFFSVVPKIAGIIALVRITHTFFGDSQNILQISWVGILSVVGALTLTVGNVSALNQSSIKRMLAYSSISHAGMMILGVVVVSEVGNRAILFYGVTYLFMTMVAFYVTSFVQDKYGNDKFERFAGLIYKHPLMAIAMITVMFSLTGLPPLSGFIAKFNILAAIISKKYYALAIVAALNSVVSLYYYLKLVRQMVFRTAESEERIEGFGVRNQVIITAMTIPVIFLGIFWEKLILLADGAKLLVR